MTIEGFLVSNFFYALKMKALAIYILCLYAFVLFSCDKNEDPQLLLVNLSPEWNQSPETEKMSIAQLYPYKEKLFCLSEKSGIQVSSHGITWQSANQGIKGTKDSNDPTDTIINGYNISGYGDYLYVLVTGDNIYVSNDIGHSWDSTLYNINGWLFGASNICAIDESVICASSGSGRFIYCRSEDYGVDWSEQSMDFGQYLREYKVFEEKSYAISLEEGLVQTSDKGISWSTVGFKGQYIYDYLISSESMVVASEEGLFLSFDNGKNWNQANEDGLSGKSVHLLEHHGDWYFAVSESSELFISKFRNVDFSFWNKIELYDVPPFADSKSISAIKYFNELLIIGTNDYAEEDGYGIWYAEMILDNRSVPVD